MRRLWIGARPTNNLAEPEADAVNYGSRRRFGEWDVSSCRKMAFERMFRTKFRFRRPFGECPLGLGRRKPIYGVNDALECRFQGSGSLPVHVEGSDKPVKNINCSRL